MTGKLSKNFHGVGIGPLSKILAVKSRTWVFEASLLHKNVSLCTVTFGEKVLALSKSRGTSNLNK